MAGHVVTQVVADAVGVPAGPGQQVLHAVWIGVAGVLGDGPAVLPRQVRQQPEQEPAGPAAGLDPDEPARHPIEQPVGFGLPSDTFYAVAVLRPGPPCRVDHDLRLEY